MTRRIAITILLTVCAAILVAGLATWFTTRVIMLSDLDATIVHRVEILTVSPTSGADAPAAFGDDRYVIKGPLDRTLSRQPALPTRTVQPHVVDRAFVQLPEGRFRRLTLKVVHDDQEEPSTVIYSASTADFDWVLQRLALALASCGLLGGSVAAFIAALLARVALRPLNHTADIIGGINEANLDRRLDPLLLPVELRPMAGHLNGMIERLQLAFEQRRRFLADASHELRTPVAALITTMEVALRRPRSSAELTETIETCLSEARHMRLLVQALMRQVRGEGLSPAEASQTFNAAETVTQCADLARSLATEREVRVIGSVDGMIPIYAEPGRLRSVVLNLVSNAIEYTQPGGTVEVSARQQDGSAEIIVKDDGPGISPEHLPHLFQPFYRANPSQNADGHLGLGLFLVDSHVRAMGGECKVESALGRGTIFRIKLPSPAEPVETAGE